MGRFWARCKLGSDLKPRSLIHVMNLGLLGAAIYRAILIDQHSLESRALTHLESIGLGNAAFISMGGPQAHGNSLRSHPNKAVDVVVCQTFQIALGFPAINLCLLPAATFCRNRSDSSSRMRWRAPRSCSPCPLGSRRWGHRCGQARP